MAEARSRGARRGDQPPGGRKARRRRRFRRRGARGLGNHSGSGRRRSDDDRDAAAEHADRGARARGGCNRSVMTRYEEPQAAFGPPQLSFPRLTNVVKKLIIANVALFLISFALYMASDSGGGMHERIFKPLRLEP